MTKFIMRVFLLTILLIVYISSADIADNAIKAALGSSSRATTGRVTTRATTGRVTTRATTTKRPYIYCYYCNNNEGRPCPEPFYSSNPNVRVVQSYNGYCEKIGLDDGKKGPSNRGISNPGDCSRSGCYSKTIGGQRMKVCCCNRDYCNTGIASIKSSWTFALSVLALLYIFQKF